MRKWHNLGCDLDVVEYIPGAMYGIVTYPSGLRNLLDHRIWVATMLTKDEVNDYIEWCDLHCDKEIYNRISKKSSDDEWV